MGLDEYSLKSEIERKTLDAAEWLVHSKESNKITEDQFGIGILSLWNATAGLVSKETMEILTLSKEGSSVKYKRNVTLAHKTRPSIVSVSQVCGDVTIVTCEWVAEEGAWRCHKREREFKDAVLPEKEATAFMQSFVERLISSTQYTVI